MQWPYSQISSLGKSLTVCQISCLYHQGHNSLKKLHLSAGLIVLIHISVLIIMAITMVTRFVVCSIIFGIIIRSRKKTQYELANKMITVNAENIADDTISETSKEIKTFKNEAYGCIQHGTNRVDNQKESFQITH